MRTERPPRGPRGSAARRAPSTAARRGPRRCRRLEGCGRTEGGRPGGGGEEGTARGTGPAPRGGADPHRRRPESGARQRCTASAFLPATRPERLPRRGLPHPSPAHGALSRPAPPRQAGGSRGRHAGRRHFPPLTCGLRAHPAPPTPPATNRDALTAAASQWEREGGTAGRGVAAPGGCGRRCVHVGASSAAGAAVPPPPALPRQPRRARLSGTLLQERPAGPDPCRAAAPVPWDPTRAELPLPSQRPCVLLSEGPLDAERAVCAGQHPRPGRPRRARAAEEQSGGDGRPSQPGPPRTARPARPPTRPRAVGQGVPGHAPRRSRPQVRGLCPGRAFALCRARLKSPRGPGRESRRPMPAARCSGSRPVGRGPRRCPTRGAEGDGGPWGGAGRPEQVAVPPHTPAPCRRSPPPAPSRRRRSHSHHVLRRPPPRSLRAPRWPAPSPALSPPAAPPGFWPWWAPARSPPAFCSPGTRSAPVSGSGAATRPGTGSGRRGRTCGGGSGRGLLPAAAAPGEGARGSRSSPKHLEPQGGSDRSHSAPVSEPRPAGGGLTPPAGQNPSASGVRERARRGPVAIAGSAVPDSKGTVSSGGAAQPLRPRLGAGLPESGPCLPWGSAETAPGPRGGTGTAAPGSGTGSPGPAELG